MGLCPPLIIAPRAAKLAGGRGGADEAVKKVELMEISGSVQNKHFKFLPEGV